MRRLNADQRVDCGLLLLVLRDGALQLGRDLSLAGVDGCRQLGPQFHFNSLRGEERALPSLPHKH